MFKRNNGITLIALVITIIVLLILVGITLGFVSGENGILKRAVKSIEETKIAMAKEEIEMAIAEEQINVQIELGEFIWENVWNTLRKEDENLKVLENEDETFHIIYKGYEFKIDQNKQVTYIGEGEKEEEIKPTEYKITYYKNDGTQTKSEQTVPKGQTVYLQTDRFVRGGYEFEGWYTNPECTGTKVEQATDTIQVYAKWIENTQLEELGEVTVGDKTYQNSYEIWNKAQLQNFRDAVNGGNKFENCIVKQKADINLNSENWTPIGNTNQYFSGTYDGENHKIENLMVNQTTGYNHGLFGYVSGTDAVYAQIENLIVEGEVTGTCLVGGIIGRTNYANVRNLTNKVNVTSTSSQAVANGEAFSSTGGVIGLIGSAYTNVENCKNYGTIKGKQKAIGGIVGYVRNGNISGCENYASIDNAVARVGGIVGAGLVQQDTGTLTVKDCTNRGNITGNSYVGGIIGVSQYITISNCTNHATIYAKSYSVQYDGAIKTSSAGGIIGYKGMRGDYKISDCINQGSIKGEYSGVGGIAGVNCRGDMINCRNNATIEGRYYVGGICGEAGYNYSTTQTATNIKTSKNAGEVKGAYTIGGIVGVMRLTGQVEQSCNVSQVTGSGKTSDNMAECGGIVGSLSSGKVLYSYNTGNVESQCRFTGGIVGKVGKSVALDYCYNIGNVTNHSETNTERVGGIIGGVTLNNVFSGKITNCCQLKDCIKKGTDTDKLGVNEKTENEIKALNWEKFKIDSSKNEGYPILEWE